MKMYRNGKECEAEMFQVPVMQKAGWSTVDPATVVDTKEANVADVAPNATDAVVADEGEDSQEDQTKVTRRRRTTA